MPILEDDVKEAMGNWMHGNQYTEVVVRRGNAAGFDVEGVDPHKRRLIVECNGEAANGDQHRRSWDNCATAMFKAIMWKASPDPANDLIGVAFPDTPEYHNRIDILSPFCEREDIRVFWVEESGVVSHW